LSKTSREQDNEIDSYEKLPTQKELFMIIQDLSKRISKVEKENCHLKCTVRRKIKFTDILEQSPPPEFLFNSWQNIILEHVEHYLETVFANTLFHATIELFDHFIDNYGDKLPIRAFDIKPNTFYIYDSDKSWVVIPPPEFNKLLAIISHRFIVEFNRCWVQPNQDKIANDNSYKDMYNSYYLKVLGGERSDEHRYSKIRHVLYNKLKQNISSKCIE
jgi:hypothetical protein